MPNVSLESETSNKFEETFHFLQSKAFTPFTLCNMNQTIKKILEQKKKKSK